MLGLSWHQFNFGRINAEIDQIKNQETKVLDEYWLAVVLETEDVKNPFLALDKCENSSLFNEWMLYRMTVLGRFLFPITMDGS